jgi:hypothetical protein
MCVNVFCFRRAKLDNVRIQKHISFSQSRDFQEVVAAYSGSSTRSSPCTTRSQSPACTIQAEALGSKKEFTITMEELSKVGFEELLDQQFTTPQKAKNEQGDKDTPDYKVAMSKASFGSKVFCGENFAKSSTNASLSSTMASDGDGDAQSKDAEDADDDDEDTDSLLGAALAASKNTNRFKAKAWMKSVVKTKKRACSTEEGREGEVASCQRSTKGCKSSTKEKKDGCQSTESSYMQEKKSYRCQQRKEAS